MNVYMASLWHEGQDPFIEIVAMDRALCQKAMSDAADDELDSQRIYLPTEMVSDDIKTDGVHEVDVETLELQPDQAVDLAQDGVLLIYTW